MTVSTHLSVSIKYLHINGFCYLLNGQINHKSPTLIFDDKTTNNNSRTVYAETKETIDMSMKCDIQ